MLGEELKKIIVVSLYAHLLKLVLKSGLHEVRMGYPSVIELLILKKNQDI